MSSTRRVKDGEQRRQNGWASAAEYDVLRGLNGTAVAFKAALQDSQEKKELLYFLQALSLREGCVKRIARELVEMFPERIGTSTMHQIGCKPGKRLTEKQSLAIEDELNPETALWRALDAHTLIGQDDDRTEVQTRLKSADEFLSECRYRAERMDSFIEELCCNPKMQLVKPGEPIAASDYRRKVSEAMDEEGESRYTNAAVSFFRDVLGALFEFKRRYEDRIRTDHVETSIGKIVFEAMDYVLETGRSALIEGNSGFGKTTALKAWCEMHLGRARYIQLSGISSRSSFLKRIAKACGVASGGGMSADRIQTRVEEFLQRTKLILVIDEAQYLWPQGKRITSHPELINWVNTALYNEGVPFALSATKQFSLRRQVVENQTSWSSEQLRRRTRKVFPLPDAPTTDDLRAVARKLLNGLGETAVEFVAGYAMASRGYFQTITDAIEDAQLIARRSGRDRITGKDLQIAVKEWRAPSDAALQRVFDAKPDKARRAKRVADYEDSATTEAPVEEPLNRLSGCVQDAFSGVAGRRETQPTTPPALVPG